MDSRKFNPSKIYSYNLWYYENLVLVHYDAYAYYIKASENSSFRLSYFLEYFASPEVNDKIQEE